MQAYINIIIRNSVCVSRSKRLKGEKMTLLQIEDALTDDEELAQGDGLTVKCSWCGEIIDLQGKELALAMCGACYEQMLAEFLRAQQTNQPSRHASDR